jgi:two-component system, LytTR family, sensor histidine kinase AlgZ
MINPKKHTKTAQNTRVQQGQAQPGNDEFFIPDLCNTRAVLILIVTSEMFALIVVLVAHPLPWFNWTSMALISLLIQWITLSSAAIICTLRPVLANMSQSMALSLCMLVVFIDTGVFSLVGQWVFAPVLPGIDTWEQLDYWGVVQNMLIGGLISSMVFRYFLVQHRLRVQQSAELNARLQSLQSRIRPHFLFNSMNIIASLIASDPKTAEAVVEDLSELFRASLKETANAVPLKNEIDLCKKYARIEQLRLGKRLQVNWHEHDFPADLYQQIEIPLLLLQPLVENAIYHGIQPLPEGGTVNITLSAQNDIFTVTITNPLVTNYAAKSNGKGNQMAVNNIRHRLLAIYGDQASLEQREVNGEYVTVLSFPY